MASQLVVVNFEMISLEGIHKRNELLMGRGMLVDALGRVENCMQMLTFVLQLLMGQKGMSFLARCWIGMNLMVNYLPTQK